MKNPVSFGTVLIRRFIAVIALAFVAGNATAQTYTQNFDGASDGDTDLGDGTTINTNVDASVASVQGGALRLTEDGVASTLSSFIIPSPGAGVADSWSATFDVSLGGGGAMPADGFAFGMGPFADEDLGTGEEGFGTGLAIEFDTWDNGGEGAANGIGIDISVDTLDVDDGQAREDAGADPLDNRFYKFDDEFRPVEIVYADGAVWVLLDGCPIFEGVEVPDYAPADDDSFGFSARTGGATETLLIDNLVITTPGVAPTHDPKIEAASKIGFETTTIGETSTVSLSVSNGGSANMLEITEAELAGDDAAAFSINTAFPLMIAPGASASIELEFQAAEPAGSKKATLILTNNDEIEKLRSLEIAVSGIALPETIESFTYQQDFSGIANDETEIGDGTSVSSNNDAAFVVDEALQLSEDGIGSTLSGWVIPNDVLGPAVAQGWQARFDYALSGGGAQPADGFAFVFGFIDEGAQFGEEGPGTGLAIEFDTWDNAGEGFDNGIGVDVSVDGSDVIDGQLREEAGADPTENMFFNFDGEFRPVEITYVQVDGSTGRITVKMNGETLFEDLEVENIEPGVDWNFAFGARTGGAFETLLLDNVIITSPPPASYRQDFNGIDDDETELGDGSTLASNNAVTKVIANALQLTADGTGSSTGNYRIPPLGAQAQESFSARFDLALSAGGDPADGFSFNFGAIPEPLGGSEEGFGVGLAVEFDTWNNGGEDADNGIGIDVSVDGTTVGMNRAAAGVSAKDSGLFDFSGDFVPVEIIWHGGEGGNGTIDVTVGGVFIYDDLAVPGFTPGVDDVIVFAARTGGATETVLLDNLNISAPAVASQVRDPKFAGDRSIAIAAPAGQVVMGSALIMNGGASKDLVISEATLSGPGAARFEFNTATPITIPPGASATIDVTFTAPNELGVISADLLLKNNDSLESARDARIRLEGTVTVNSYVQDFDGIADGETEIGDGSIIISNNDSTRVVDGTLQLTEDGVGSTSSAFKTPSLGETVVNGFTAQFDFALAGGGAQPADGFSFNFGDIADAGAAGEEGFGNGLAVEFDTWDNAGEGDDTGIGLDVSVDGGTVPDGMLREPLELNDDDFPANRFFVFDDVFRAVTITWVRDPDGGTVTVSIDDDVIYEDLPTPGLDPQPDWRYAWGARTGGATENLRLDNIAIGPGSGLNRPGFEITNITRDPATNNVSITWRSRPGRTYIIEASPDLIDREELQDGYESQGEETSFTEEGVPADTKVRYYFVKEEEG